ncbi:hypothetical protein Tco_0999345 [Tanacetum coccineum]
MFVFFVNTLLQNTMAEQNVPTQPPTRTDEQIVPRSQWLIIGKSNLLFNAQKIQKNPIFQISVDILSNTNFFRAFTASASVPAIYLQQFWNTMKYDEKSGVYSCQIDEQWFDLSADLLRKALAITPVIPAQPFELPPSGNTVIDFVNELGKDLGCDKPRTPSSANAVGNHHSTNVDHAELLWEEFIMGSKQFSTQGERKVIHESSSTSDSERTESETESADHKDEFVHIDDPSHQNHQSTPPVIPPFTEFSYPNHLHGHTSSNIYRSYNNHHISPEITPFIELLLRVARLEQESLKSMIKLDLEEFDLKKCSLQTMNKEQDNQQKYCPTTIVYHALIEALNSR